MKVAFCFLLYDSVKHAKAWETFFSEDEDNTASIYAHIKQVSEKTQPWLKKHKIQTVKTDYCDVSLVYAWIKLLENALKNPDNKYFVILSGECIPLFSYPETYKKITRSKKSRVNCDLNAESYDDTGLYWSDQWVILTRREANLLVKLKTTEKGRKFTKEILKKIEDYCPDEILPINWFVKHYGKPHTQKYKKYIRSIPATYTFWGPEGGSPRKFNAPKMLKKRAKICGSEALFARKFNNKAARLLSGSC